jgi:hypothetical protein
MSSDSDSEPAAPPADECERVKAKLRDVARPMGS